MSFKPATDEEHEHLQLGCGACRKMAAKWKSEVEELRAKLEQNDPPSCGQQAGPVAGSVDDIIQQRYASVSRTDLLEVNVVDILDLLAALEGEQNRHARRIDALESILHSKPEPEPAVPVSELWKMIDEWQSGEVPMVRLVEAAIAKAEGGAK